MTKENARGQSKLVGYLIIIIYIPESEERRKIGKGDVQERINL